jgi:hypothetical protein
MRSIYWLVDGKYYRNASQVVRRFAHRIITAALQKQVSSIEKASEKYSVVNELTKTIHDPVEVRDQVIGSCSPYRPNISH